MTIFLAELLVVIFLLTLFICPHFLCVLTEKWIHKNAVHSIIGIQSAHMHCPVRHSHRINILLTLSLWYLCDSSWAYIYLLYTTSDNCVHSWFISSVDIRISYKHIQYRDVLLVQTIYRVKRNKLLKSLSHQVDIVRVSTEIVCLVQWTFDESTITHSHQRFRFLYGRPFGYLTNTLKLVYSVHEEHLVVHPSAQRHKTNNPRHHWAHHDQTTHRQAPNSHCFHPHTSHHLHISFICDDKAEL